MLMCPPRAKEARATTIMKTFMFDERSLCAFLKVIQIGFRVPKPIEKIAIKRIDLNLNVLILELSQIESIFFELAVRNCCSSNSYTFADGMVLFYIASALT